MKIDHFILILHGIIARTAIFAIFFHKNRHKSDIFQSIKKSEIQIVSIYDRMLWCKFQQNRTKNATPDTFCVKYSKFHIFVFFYKRFYVTHELKKGITSESGWILTFCKKPLFHHVEICQISSTWFFWPWPPYRLNPLINPLISRCENLKKLFNNSLHGALPLAGVRI